MSLFKFFPVAMLAAITAAAAQQEISVNKKDGVFAKGEEIVFTMKTPAEPGKTVRYRLSGDREYTKWQEIPADGKTIPVKFKLNAPGWVMLQSSLFAKGDKNFKVKSVACGAIVAPDEIRQASGEPADFDAFWQKNIADLKKIPFNTQVVSKEEKRGAVVYVCNDVKIDSLGAQKVSGYMCYPKDAAPKSLPAFVAFHGAGVYSASKSCMPNVLSFDVNAHGVENGKPSGYYKNLYATEFKNYPHRAKNNRDQFYFRNMFIRVYRALEYAKSMPQWNGKVLVVFGSSQGGAQALVAAGLDKDVTFCAAGVPAMCDHHGCMANRQSGWPRLFGNKGGVPSDPAVAATAAYYDAATFAKRIKCDTQVSVGLIDTVCAPTSVYSAYNNVPASHRSKIDIAPAKDHDGSIIDTKHFHQRLK